MKYLCFILFLLALTACDPKVVFREPQPEGRKDMSKFPSKYCGTYMQMDDSSIFILTSKRIFQMYEEQLADPIDKIMEDEEIELRNDSLIITGTTIGFPAIRRNDSVFCRVVLYDTLFDIQRGDRLRKLKSNFFLNSPIDSLWQVLKLNFSKKGPVYMYEIDHKTEIDIFEKYCIVETISNKQGSPSRYILEPTIQELKEILRDNTFSKITEYSMVSQETILYPGIQ